MVKDHAFIIRPEWFGAYGLDVNKNFMQSPECPCGCGGTVSILLDKFDDVRNFACGVLSENDCCHCAIFVHAITGKMYGFAKMLDDNEDIKLFTFSCEKPDFGFFKQIDDIYEFHCYGLVIESQPGQWKIVEK